MSGGSERRQKEQEGSFADGENSLALRLENVSLREPLSDLRAANANPYRALIGARGFALSTKNREAGAFAPTSLFLVDPTRDHSVSRKKVYG